MVKTYLLKWISLAGLMAEDSPVRHKAKRRRVRTVMQELVYLAAHIYEHSHHLVMRFGRTTTGFQAFQRVYQQLCYGLTLTFLFLTFFAPIWFNDLF